MLSNLKKSKKGFTLVELIVVIAIIAILAAVAVPVTLSYVGKSKITTATTEVASAIDTLSTTIAGLTGESTDFSDATKIVVLTTEFVKNFPAITDSSIVSITIVKAEANSATLVVTSSVVGDDGNAITKSLLINSIQGPETALVVWAPVA